MFGGFRPSSIPKKKGRAARAGCGKPYDNAGRGRLWHHLEQNWRILELMKSIGPSERRREKASRCWAVSIRVCKSGRQNFSRYAIKSITALVSLYGVVVVRRSTEMLKQRLGRSSVWTASAQGWELPDNHASSPDFKAYEMRHHRSGGRDHCGQQDPKMRGIWYTQRPTPECSSSSIGFFCWLILNWH